MLFYLNFAEKILDIYAGKSPFIPCIDQQDFNFYYEIRNSLASCYYRSDKFVEAIKNSNHSLLKAIPYSSSKPVDIYDDNCQQIICEFEALLWAIAGHLERLGKLLVLNYGKPPKARLDIVIANLPDNNELKKVLSTQCDIIDYIFELRNFSLHRMSLIHALKISVYKSKLLIKLPDYSSIIIRNKINKPDDLNYTEKRNHTDEGYKWFGALENCSSNIYLDYFNHRLNEYKKRKFNTR